MTFLVLLVLLVLAYHLGRRHGLPGRARHSSGRALSRLKSATEGILPLRLHKAKEAKMPLLSLPPVGVAMLIFKDTRIASPKLEPEPTPGIRSSNLRGRTDVVLIEAIGYESDEEAFTAISRAEQACLDSDLAISYAKPEDSMYPARLVRRKLQP